MKKIYNIILVVMLATTATFTSCSKSDVEPLTQIETVDHFVALGEVGFGLSIYDSSLDGFKPNFESWPSSASIYFSTPDSTFTFEKINTIHGENILVSNYVQSTLGYVYVINKDYAFKPFTVVMGKVVDGKKYIKTFNIDKVNNLSINNVESK